jgi:hypothetical protein
MALPFYESQVVDSLLLQKSGNTALNESTSNDLDYESYQ